jgi:hypothetical protein
MRGSFLIAIVLAVFFILSCGWLTAAPIANPTPGPCCIDGVCYPKRETWGFYGTRWRQWPNDLRPEIPGRSDLPPKPELPDELPSVILPEPKDEDLHAPPPTKQAEADAEGMAPAKEDAGPSLPLVPAMPVLPGTSPKPLVPTLPGDVGVPDAGGGLVPGKVAPGDADSDPPPALPFNAPTDKPGDKPKLDFKLQQIQPMRRPESELDLPPPLPKGISRSGSATPADRQVTSSPSVSKRRLPAVSNPRAVVRADIAVVPVSLTRPPAAGDGNVATTIYGFPTQLR